MDLISLGILLPLLIWRYTKHVSYARTVFETWSGLVIWSLVNCLLFPFVFYWLGYKKAFHIFLEPPMIAGAVLTGWIWGMGLATALLLVRLAWGFINRSIRRFKKHD